MFFRMLKKMIYYRQEILMDIIGFVGQQVQHSHIIIKVWI